MVKKTVSFKTKRGKRVSFVTGGPKRKRSKSLWSIALKKSGYFQKGASFKPLPRKGSREYKKVKELHKSMKEKNSRPKSRSRSR